MMCYGSLPTSADEPNGRFRRTQKSGGAQPSASKEADQSGKRSVPTAPSSKSLQALAAAAQAASSPDHTEGVATSSSSRSKQAVPGKKRSLDAEEGAESEADQDTGSAGNSQGTKRARLVWTAELHARFMRAMNHLV